METKVDWKQRIKCDLIHLVLHLIYNHLSRGKHRNNGIWSIASDLTVFQIMIKLANKYDLYKSWNIPRLTQFPEEFLNIPTENIYILLMKYTVDQDDDKKSKENVKENQNDNLIGRIIDNVTDDPKTLDDSNSTNLDEFTDLMCDTGKLDNISKPDHQFELNESVLNGIVRSAFDRSKDRGKGVNSFRSSFTPFVPLISTKTMRTDVRPTFSP